MTNMEEFKAMFDKVGQKYQIFENNNNFSDSKYQMVVDPEYNNWYVVYIYFDKNGKYVRIDAGDCGS